MNFQGNFPKLWAAAWAIAHDNGAINRVEDSKEVILRMAEGAIKEQGANLVSAELFLANLSPEDFEELCIGEEGKVEAPEYVSDVLNAMFDRC